MVHLFIKPTFPILRRLKGGLLSVLSCLISSGWLWRRGKIFSGVPSERAEGDSHILSQGTGDKEKNLFQEAGQAGDQDPREDVAIPPLKMFKDIAMNSLLYHQSSHALSRGWTNKVYRSLLI